MDLVVSNLAGSLPELVALAREQAGGPAGGADVLELRLDACGGATVDDLRRAFAELSRPVLATANGPEAFGTFAGTDAERLDLLRRASDAGAAWVDVPWTLARELGPTRARRVVSRHVTEGTPRDLESIVAEVERAAAFPVMPGMTRTADDGRRDPGRDTSTGATATPNPSRADRIKLVTHAACAEDGLRVLRLARDRARAGRPIVAFASGAAGSFTRVLAPVFGSLATYAAPARGTGGGATAPGQIPWDALRAAWPAGGATPATRVLGVAARPAAGSLSPRLHGSALRLAGMDAVYVAFEPADCAAFLALATDLGVHGLSVTMPFKEEAARLASSRDDAVLACGAANTLERTEDGWRASNTDAGAVRTCILRALRETGQPLSSAVVVVVGTGGAARAALHALQEACLVVAGRDATKRAALAREFDAEACAIEDLVEIPHDVLVNTTPLGSRTHPGQMPVPPRALRRGSIVLDAVYRPAETPLLSAARALGARTIEGRAWFLEQAAAQFRAFTGTDAPIEAMRAELAAALAEDAP